MNTIALDRTCYWLTMPDIEEAFFETEQQLIAVANSKECLIKQASNLKRLENERIGIKQQIYSLKIQSDQNFVQTIEQLCMEIMRFNSEKTNAATKNKYRTSRIYKANFKQEIWINNLSKYLQYFSGPRSMHLQGKVRLNIYSHIPKKTYLRDHLNLCSTTGTFSANTFNISMDHDVITSH